MANKRKGQLTTTGEWAKHLRKTLKRCFWKSERKAGKNAIEKELIEQNDHKNNENN